MRKVELELSQELENIVLPTSGKFPDWLEGVLVRNGPVQFSIDNQQVGHWFDGLGMLHAFSFHQGKVTYSNKFLQTHAFEAVTQNGTFNYVGFASDPCGTLFKRLKAYFFPSSNTLIHNANINVAKYADEYVALYETPLPIRFNPKTLETLGVFDYQDHLFKSSCFESAHPHYDAQTVQHINYLVEYGFDSKYLIYSLGLDANRKIISEIKVGRPSYMHSFSVTENYIILAEYPFVVNPSDFLLKGLPFIKNFKWEPERGTQFTVVDKRSGKIISRILTEAFFAFHHINAYENQNEIIIDIITYPDVSIIQDLAHHAWMDLHTKTILKGKEEFQTTLKRFRLMPSKGTLSTESIFNEVHELPRIHPSYDTKSYQFVYASDIRKPYRPEDERKIYKINVDDKEITSWQEPLCYPGEPVFVPLPNGTKEDEGIILVVIINLKSSTSFLLCLEASTFTEIARAEVPHKIPQGLHGQLFLNN